MKNSQKGFIIPLLSAVIALLIIGGGIYIYQEKKQNVSAVQQKGIAPEPATNDGSMPTVPAKTNIKTSVTVLFPNGGETFKTGEKIQIKWKTVNNSGPIHVSLAAKDGNTIIKQITDETGTSDAGSYSWTIGSSIMPGEYKISIQTADGKEYSAGQNYAYDSSDSAFFISAPASAILHYSDPFGFSFSYSNALDFSTKTGPDYGNVSGKIIVLTDKDADTISIGTAEGAQVKNIDTKFGDVTYYFDSNSGSWMENANTDMNPGIRVAVPAFYTDSGLPVFRGVGRWKTDIVALSHTKFLIVNMSGSGNTNPLDPFVKTISSSN